MKADGMKLNYYGVTLLTNYQRGDSNTTQHMGQGGNLACFGQRVSVFYHKAPEHLISPDLVHIFRHKAMKGCSCRGYSLCWSSVRLFLCIFTCLTLVIFVKSFFEGWGALFLLILSTERWLFKGLHVIYLEQSKKKWPGGLGCIL